jgi:hypothetical protein
MQALMQFKPAMPKFVSKISADRSILRYGKIQDLIPAFIRGRRIFMNLKREGLVLNIGCRPCTDPKELISTLIGA